MNWRTKQLTEHVAVCAVCGNPDKKYLCAMGVTLRNQAFDRGVLRSAVHEAIELGETLFMLRKA